MFQGGLLSAVPADRESSSAPGVGPDARALLRQCIAMFVEPVRDGVRASLSGTNNLFDAEAGVPPGVVAAFRECRAEWIVEFERALDAGMRARLDGVRRHPRRPDADNASAGFELLATEEQSSQAALIEAVRRLETATRLEVAALGPRVAVLLGEPVVAKPDNPFAPPYVLDAIGATARATWATPRTWRLLMRRVADDVAPLLKRIYVAQNRLLADHGVLPDIKAWLRSRSRFRPPEDRDLVAAYRKLESAARRHGTLARPVRASELELAPIEPRRAEAQAAPLPRNSGPSKTAASPAPAPQPAISDAELRSALSTLLPKAAPPPEEPALGARWKEDDPSGLPSLRVPVVATTPQPGMLPALAQLAALDLRPAVAARIRRRDGSAADPAMIPWNLLPTLHAALAGERPTPEVSSTIGLLGAMLDYVFADPRVPEALYALFERLQVPVLAAALSDESFFASRDHPARALLNELADAALGAADDVEYLARLRAAGAEAVAQACNSGRFGPGAFAGALARVRAFTDDECRATARKIERDIATAEAAERRDLARSRAAQAVRERLALVEVPASVRAFAQGTWVEYLATIERTGDPDGELSSAALRTLDELVWSVAPKEQPEERQRLRERIPSLVAALRRGCTAAALAPERVELFMSDLYQLHAAASKSPRLASGAAAVSPVAGPPGGDAAAAAGRGEDVIAEIVPGTWIRFRRGDAETHERLCWASVVREHYVFAGRGSQRGRVMTPAELARDLARGDAVVHAEPVPLFERALDAAFDAAGGAASRNFRYTDSGGAGRPG